MVVPNNDTVTIRGRIERITFRNDENGYTVSQVREDGGEMITAVGPLADANPGSGLVLTGRWVVHPRFGRQFHIQSYSVEVPTDIPGIKKYLASGLVKGIGPRTAERIVGHFGVETLSVISDSPERLREVPGIGKSKAATIADAWKAQEGTRAAMLQLQEYGISPAYAVRVLKAYGDRAGSVIRENPYRLAADVQGIGFKVADRIAATTGIAPDSPARAAAGIEYTLNRAADEGHVFLPLHELLERAEHILGIGRTTIEAALYDLSGRGRVVIDKSHTQGGASAEAATHAAPAEDASVYLNLYYVCETGIARGLRRLAESPGSMKPVDTGGTLAWAGERLSITFAPEQAAAVTAAVGGKVTVITGGPGTGKTTILNAIIRIAERAGAAIRLAAPTGRAARRMAETSGREAGTIHRLLGVDPADGRFRHNADNPIDCDLLIIDEASMIDTVLMYSLVRAIPEAASLVLVGDSDQLPSVGAGSVLKDIIVSGAVPVVRLNQIFRQTEGSLITANAHRIREGQMPVFGKDPQADFFFISQRDPQKIPEVIKELVTSRIPARFGFDPVDDIQVMVPMHKGVAGIENLDRILGMALNPDKPGIERGGRRFAEGDKVMQVRNDYGRDVYNGDVGRVLRIDEDEGILTVSFDGRPVEYVFSDLDGLTTAYAVSIHKSQGAEYPAVIIPLVMQHYLLLQRNLLYTAVTRGRRLVVVIGSMKALSTAVRNDKIRRRFTRLAGRLL